MSAMVGSRKWRKRRARELERAAVEVLVEEDRRREGIHARAVADLRRETGRIDEWLDHMFRVRTQLEIVAKTGGLREYVDEAPPVSIASYDGSISTVAMPKIRHREDRLFRLGVDVSMLALEVAELPEEVIRPIAAMLGRRVLRDAVAELAKERRGGGRSQVERDGIAELAAMAARVVHD